MNVSGTDKLDAVADGRRSWFGPRLSADDVAELTQNVATLSAQGLPSDAGLAALAEETTSRRLRAVLGDMSARLARGERLDAAVEAQQDRLPAHLRGLVLAGVRSGRLAETFQQYVNHQQLAGELNRRIWAALAYPLLVLGFAVVMLVFLEIMVIRHFVSIFAEFEAELPWATLLVINLSAGFVWALAGALIGALILWIVSRMTLSPPLARRLACRIPLLGPQWRFCALARFSHLAALLLEAGIPWTVTLRWSSNASGDVDLADACHTVAGDIEAGQSLAASRTCQTRLPAGLGQMLAWGEAHNMLPEALRTAAEMYEGRAQVQTSFIVAVAPVLLLAAVLAIVGFLVSALLMPLINLIDQLSW